MAATDYAAVVQQLYISYFGRPADTYALQAFTTQLAAADTTGTLVTTPLLSAYAQANPTSAVGKLVASFAGKPEAVALYGTGTDILSISKFVNAIYQNVLHRDADTDGGTYWINAIMSGGVSKENAALAITEGALGNTTPQGLIDAALVKNTAAVAIDFTNSLDTIPKINAFSGDAAAAYARTLLSQVTATTDLTAYHANVLQAITVLITPPSTVTALTENVDTLVGTSGNNVFNGTEKTFTGLDSIDGGAGNDTLNLSDVSAGATLDLSVATVKNVENLVLTSVKGLANGAADVSGWTGLTSATFNLNKIDAADQAVTVAGTTAVTVNATGLIPTATLKVTGGSTSTINLAASGTTDNSAKTITVKGTAGATTAVTVNQTVSGTAKAAAVSITDPNAGGSKASTIATVSLSGLTDGAATIASDALTSLTLSGSTKAVTVTAAAGTRTLGVTLNGDTSGAAVTDATATTLNVTTTGTKSSAVALTAGAATKVGITAGVDLTGTLTAGAATAITIAGAGKVGLTSLTAGSLTSIDASTNAGGVTLGTALGNGVAFTGGAGKDSIAIGATTKAIAMGAGDDTVTISANVGAGGTIDGGTGTDTLAGTAAALGTLTAAPTDAAKYTGFETIKVTDALTNGASVDVSKIGGVVNFTAGAGVANTATATATGLGQNATVAIEGVDAAIAAVKEVFTVDLAGTAAAIGADTYAFDGTTITLAGGETAAQIATAIAAGTYANWTAVLNGTAVTFTQKVGAAFPDADATAFVYTNVGGATTHVETFTTTTQGVTVAAQSATGKLALVQAADTAADTINLKLNTNYIENNDATSTINTATHTVDASLIETLKVVSTGTGSAALTSTSADGVNNTLVVTDVALVNLSVTGDQAFTFASAALQTKLATIDASALTAGATIDGSLSAAGSVALTIKGSTTAANSLTGGAANDTITGGAKADTIKGGAGGDTLTGGAGNDTFAYAAGDSSIGTGKFDTIADFKANTYGTGTAGAAGISASATVSKWTGDVLQFAKLGSGAGGVIVDVFTSAADASTYLANHTGTANTVVAALDSTGNNLYVDNTGDGIADFYIHLTGVSTITAAAFTVV